MAEGFIRKRGDAWQVIVYAGRDPITGRKRQISRNVRGTKREAQAVRARLLVEVDEGRHITTGATFGDLVEQWFRHASPDWSPKTAAETRRLIERVVKPRLADVELKRLKTADLDRLYASLRRSGGHAGGPLAPATVRRVHTHGGPPGVPAGRAMGMAVVQSRGACEPAAGAKAEHHTANP